MTREQALELAENISPHWDYELLFYFNDDLEPFCSSCAVEFLRENNDGLGGTIESVCVECGDMYSESISCIHCGLELSMWGE